MKKLLPLTFILFTISCQFSKSQNIYSKFFYGQNKFYNGYATASTSENGFVIAGTSYDTISNGFVVKMDSMANPIWEREVSSVYSFYSVTYTFDSGVVAAGTYLNRYNVLFIKFDSNGDSLWTCVINYPYLINDLYSLQQTFDSGFVITGVIYGTPSIFVSKISAAGDHVWSKFIDIGNLENNGYSICQTPDSGLIVAGYGEDHPGASTFYINPSLVKIDKAGTIQWVKKFNKPVYEAGWFTDLQIVNDGILCLAAFLGGTNLIKIDFTGNVMWSKRYPLLWSGCGNCGTAKITSTSDSCFIINDFPWFDILKVNSTGDVLWTKNDMFNGLDVLETSSGGLLFFGTGYNSSFGWNGLTGIIKTDSLGNGSPCIMQYAITASADSIISTPSSFIETNGGIQVASNLMITSQAIILDSGCIEIPLGINEHSQLENVSLYPNPNTGQFNIKLENSTEAKIIIYNTLGQVVYYKYGLLENNIPVSIEVAAGVYFLKIESVKNTLVKKFIISQ